MKNHANYLKAGYYVDSDHQHVLEFAQNNTRAASSEIEKAIDLYYAVRDGFRYNPYKIILRPEALKASFLLTKSDGYCVEKACLLAACARAVGIPSRLGFANVRNHIGTEKLVQYLQTDIMVFHGYTELFLEGIWVKATPAFNQSLCEKIGVHPLEFDGKNDAVFQEYDPKGNQFMEYLHDYGVYDDVPYHEFVRALAENYPHLLKMGSKENIWEF